MEKLELKHLAPYLPYGLKTKGLTSIYPDPIITGVLSSNKHVYWNYHGATGAWKLEDIKPILRPLSDLTEDHKKNCEYNSLEVLIDVIKSQEVETKIWYDLLQNHWDVFSLIEKNLAIDINTLD